ncbi:hypothetical protein CPB86DRAFT_796419 [Serendipita vermifera]|nr:hypothetical protein CPB86DRAFT_796419 [Serendipita vermifera]
MCQIGKCVYHTRPLQSLDDKWWDVDMTSLQGKLENVKIVFLRDSSRTSQRVLKAAYNIRALYWDQYFSHNPSMPAPPTRTTLLSMVLDLREMKHLTHLSLNGLECSQFFDDYINGELVFRSVQYLSITFSSSERLSADLASSSPSNSRNNVWPFPKLTALKVRGDIQAVYGSAVLDFFRTCGQTVTEFVEYRPIIIKGKIPKAFPQLSLYFPNLVLYGIGLYEFFGHRISSAELSTLSYTPRSPSFTLLLYGFLSIFWQRGERCIEIMRIIRARWKITRIMMYDTWDKLESRLKKHPKNKLQPMLDDLKAFFAILGPPKQFCDREGRASPSPPKSRNNVWPFPKLRTLKNFLALWGAVHRDNAHYSCKMENTENHDFWVLLGNSVIEKVFHYTMPHFNKTNIGSSTSVEGSPRSQVTRSIGGHAHRLLVCLDMETESTLSRLPVEIWILIFCYACTSPFAPFVDEAHNHLSPSISNNFELFEVVYHPFEVYHESDELFKTLRLVCRDWASIVDSLSIRYLFTDMKSFSFPHCSAQKLSSVEMIHLLRRWDAEYCFCACWRKCPDGGCRSLDGLMDPREEDYWNSNDILSNSILRNVKIVFLRDQPSRYERILKATANVRALYWDSHPHEPTLFDSFDSTHLTHLELRNLRCAQFLEGYVNGSLTIQSLRYLSLHFILGFSLDDWVLLTDTNKAPAFPRLKSLKIAGDIEPEFQEGINDFLRGSGRTVTEFVEHYIPPNSHRLSRTMDHVFPSLSSYFPNLRLYGTNLGDLLYDSNRVTDFRISPFSPKEPSFTLLLYNFIPSLLSRPESVITSLLIVKGQWKVTRIMMHNTWSDLESRLMNYSEGILPNVLSWIQAFFKSLGGSVEFCDQEGVSLHEAKFDHNHEWIEFFRNSVVPVPKLDVSHTRDLKVLPLQESSK